MFARALDARREPQRLVGGDARRGFDCPEARPPFRQRAGLVDDERVDRLEPLERLGVADENAGARADADADHDRHRRRKSKRAGAGDD